MKSEEIDGITGAEHDSYEDKLKSANMKRFVLGLTRCKHQNQHWWVFCHEWIPGLLRQELHLTRLLAPVWWRGWRNRLLGTGATKLALSNFNTVKTRCNSLREMAKGIKTPPLFTSHSGTYSFIKAKISPAFLFLVYLKANSPALQKKYKDIFVL